MTASTTELPALTADLDSHWVAIGRFFISRKLRSKLHHGMAAELSPVQLAAVAQLAEGPVRIGLLAARLGLAESSVTRLVDRLEGYRLVTRRALPADRRSVAVQLTATGRRVADQVARGRRAYLTTLLETLEPAERGELVRLFAKVAGTLADQERTFATAGGARIS